MSRCFPFPPPGYETKHRLEDFILLKEAKRKEKKEKKDKDRRRDKDKKERDGSEKQRDKKDRKGKRKNKKEKHGIKKKDKDDRGREKEKSSDRNGEKVHPEVHNKYSSVEDEGKWSTFSQGQNGKKPLQSILPSQATKEGRFVQELDRRIRDDEKGRGSLFPQRVADVGRRDQEAAAGTALWNPSQVLAEGKHNDRDKSFQGKKLESQRRNGEFIGKASVQNLNHVAESNNEGIPRPLVEHNDSRLEDNEKYKEPGGNEQGDKREDRVKKNRVKDKHKKKEKKEDKKERKEEKKEKANVNIGNGKSETEKLKNSGRNDLAGAACNISANVLKDVNGAALNEGYIRKRKDVDTNGFLHESEIRPNKVLALHQSTENGKKLEASSKSSSDTHVFPNNVFLDHHCQLNNGIIEATKPSPSRANPSGINMFSDQIVVPPKMQHPDFNEPLRMPKKDHSAGAPKRPPHPDSKYLSQILTVPAVGDWSEDNDQEWLFSKNGHPKKPEPQPVGVTEELQVWSEAVHIESANIWALPYVIPY